MDGSQGMAPLTPTGPYPQPRGAPSLLLGQADAECTAHTRVRLGEMPPLLQSGSCGWSVMETTPNHSVGLLLSTQNVLHVHCCWTRPRTFPAHPTEAQVNLRHRGLAFPSGAAFNDLTSLLQQILLKDVQNCFHLLWAQIIYLNKVRTFLVLNWLLSHNSKTLYIFRFNTGKSKLCDIQVAQGHGLDSVTVSPCCWQRFRALPWPGLKAVGIIFHIMHDKLWNNNHDTTVQQK